MGAELLWDSLSLTFEWSGSNDSTQSCQSCDANPKEMSWAGVVQPWFGAGLPLIEPRELLVLLFPISPRLLSRR